ncbi:RNA polymerase sigma factor [Streptomyces coeruleoprunus]|uniref:RNA polymerase sigma factor n=1 Tax=Streptomyces coeruleoprunus TaxID=285563 RepID=A0ABV9X817_9ACTN
MTAPPGPADPRGKAFAAYVLPEVEVLLRVAMTLTAQPADAEDLVQDTLLRAYRSIDRFDGQHPRAWLLTIMRRAEINRHRRRRPHLLDDPDTDLDRLSTTGASGSAEEIVVGEAFDEVVDEALCALPLSTTSTARSTACSTPSRTRPTSWGWTAGSASGSSGPTTARRSCGQPWRTRCPDALRRVNTRDMRCPCSAASRKWTAC